MINTRAKRLADANNSLVKLIVLIAFSFVLHGCIGNMRCGEEVLAQQASPDNEYIAVLMLSDCGATSSFGTHVNLRRNEKEFKKESNGLIREGEVLDVMGRFPVRMEWINNKKLKITCENCIGSRSIRKEYEWGYSKDNHWGDVEIEHEFLDNGNH